jgi:hypothetical protein
MPDENIKLVEPATMTPQADVEMREAAVLFDTNRLW